MKFKLSPFLQSANGSLGELVYYELDGQLVGRRKAKPKDKLTAARSAHRQRVKLAAAWSRKTMTDPKQKAEYRTACRGHQTPYNIGFRDYLIAPVVEAIDLTGYTGKAGQSLWIKATDDFEVKQVEVMIWDAAGNLIEEGLAERGSNLTDWKYLTRTETIAGQSVRVQVTAVDRPGNRTVAERWQFLG